MRNKAARTEKAKLRLASSRCCPSDKLPCGGHCSFVVFNGEICGEKCDLSLHHVSDLGASCVCARHRVERNQPPSSSSSSPVLQPILQHGETNRVAVDVTKNVSFVAEDEVVGIPARDIRKSTFDILFANVTTFGRKVKQWIQQTEFRPDGLALVETHIADTEIDAASRFLRKEG